MHHLVVDTQILIEYRIEEYAYEIGAVREEEVVGRLDAVLEHAVGKLPRLRECQQRVTTTHGILGRRLGRDDLQNAIPLLRLGQMLYSVYALANEGLSIRERDIHARDQHGER